MTGGQVSAGEASIATLAVGRAPVVGERQSAGKDFPWTNSHHIAGDLRTGVQKLKDATPAGVLLGSGKLATELDRLDLIDEYQFLVHPRIAGHGSTLYQSGLPSARRRILAEELVMRHLQSQVQALDLERDLALPRAQQEMRLALLPVEQAPEIVEAAARVLQGPNLSIYGDGAEVLGQLGPLLNVVARAVQQATPGAAAPTRGPIGAAETEPAATA